MPLLSSARLFVSTNMVFSRVLPDSAASKLRRWHHGLPAPVHCAAFDDGSDILSLAQTKAKDEPNAPQAASMLHGETLYLTNAVRACALWVLTKAASTHEWVTAAVAVLVLDALDVYRTVFVVAAQQRGEGNRTKVDTEKPKRGERNTRDLVRLVTLVTLGSVIRDEASGMIDTFDYLSSALGEGNAGAYTTRQHARGCLLSMFWFSLLFSVALPKLQNLFLRFPSALFRSTERSISTSSNTGAPSSPTKEEQGSPFFGWAGPDRPYWSIFSLDGDRWSEHIRFTETIGIGLAFVSKVFGPFLSGPFVETGCAYGVLLTIGRIATRAAAVSSLLAAVDTNLRRKRGKEE